MFIGQTSGSNVTDFRQKHEKSHMTAQVETMVWFLINNRTKSNCSANYQVANYPQHLACTLLSGLVLITLGLNQPIVYPFKPCVFKS